VNKSKLKKLLEHHYKAFDRSKIEPDPLQFPHRYTNEKDIEISAFIASIFAYGTVTQINKTLNLIFSQMENSPLEYLTSKKISDIQNSFKSIKHRFYTSEDIICLFNFLRDIYLRNESIKSIFLNAYKQDENIRDAINSFSKYSIMNLIRLNNNRLTHGLKFMFPLPEKGSACKRMNLFLRWMVRKDELDFGLWSEIPTSHLVIPVDTHIFQIAQKLNLTTQTSVSWKMASEITENLKVFDKNDPVKYDFALCHIGIRKLSFE